MTLLRLVASLRTDSSLSGVGGHDRINRGSVTGRAMLDRQTVHVHDLAGRDRDEFPDARPSTSDPALEQCLPRRCCAKDVPIGAIIHPPNRGPSFLGKTDRAAENLRRPSRHRHRERALVQGIGERNAELREALEHQTATAEVLGIISRSPTDVQPVLDAIVESAARVCGIDDVVLRLREGDNMVPRAHFGPIPIGRVEISIDEPQYSLDARAWHASHSRRPRAERISNVGFRPAASRTFLSVPLRQQGELIGVLDARRTEVRPFTPAQIKLLETFADQAVIAIENVRLFQELKESLEQQTATSEILGVIASSPTDIQPVLDAVAENAARLCERRRRRRFVASMANVLRAGGHYGPIPARPRLSSRSAQSRSPSGRAILDRKTIHIHDLAAGRERISG